MSVPIVPLVTVLIVILLSMVVTRVATIALTLTGMSRQSARFQARSALTGAGFTTTESESVVNHPLRRRIVMTLMLIGSAGIVTVLASVMLTFASAAAAENDSNPTLTLLALVGGALGIVLLLRLRPFDRALSRLIRLTLRRFTDLEIRDYAALLDIHGAYAVTELCVDEAGWLAGRTLRDLRLGDEGVLVLGVQRIDGGYVGAPRAETRVDAGDVLILYGHGDRIAELDQRRRGPTGEARHRRAAQEHAMHRSEDAESRSAPLNPEPPPG